MKGLSRCQQLGSLFLGVAMCVFLIGCGGSKVSEANYKKVTNDMTEAQVKDILGAPTEEKSAGPAKTSIWKSGNDTISITFMDGKVKMKLSSFDVKGMMGQ